MLFSFKYESTYQGEILLLFLILLHEKALILISNLLPNYRIILHCVPQKGTGGIQSTLTCLNVNRFSKFFTNEKRIEFPTKPIYTVSQKTVPLLFLL